MSQPLDPASVASYVASAKARTDDNAFAVTSTAVALAYGASKNASETWARIYRPSSLSSARLFQWRARYRYRPLSAWLVADAAHATPVTGLLALLALDEFNLIDLRYPLTTLAPFNPVLGGKPGDPYAPSRFRWVSTGGNAGYWARS